MYIVARCTAGTSTAVVASKVSGEALFVFVFLRVERQMIFFYKSDASSGGAEGGVLCLCSSELGGFRTSTPPARGPCCVVAASAAMLRSLSRCLGFSSHCRRLC